MQNSEAINQSVKTLQHLVDEQTSELRQLKQQLQEEISKSQLLEKKSRTSDKLLEEKLRTSEHKMRAVFEAMTDIVIVFTTQGSQLKEIEILPTNATQLYEPDTDIIGQTVEQLFQDKTAPIWLKKIRQALDKKQTINFDYSLSLPGKEIWFAATISPISNNSAIWVARDISDRKRAEQILQESESRLQNLAANIQQQNQRLQREIKVRQRAEEKYHSIVENTVEGIFQSTPYGRYLSANPALARIYGYDSSQDLINSIQDISRLYVHQNRRNEFIAAIEAENQVKGFESLVYRKDGTAIWISENTRAVRDFQGMLLYYEGTVSDITERKLIQEALKFEQEQTETLLLNILPAPIAQRLQKGENPIADRFEEVSVLFADLVGFTEFSSRKTPEQLVSVLNVIFSNFDQLAKQYGLEKIKTIGDAYMVVGGVPIYRPDHAQAIAKMALSMQAAIVNVNAQIGETFKLRIGINSGPVVAGVIGLNKFIYDLWGDTVNTASRMEVNGIPGEIQLTVATYERLKEQFFLEKRGRIPIKGKGEMTTYLLRGQNY